MQETVEFKGFEPDEEVRQLVAAVARRLDHKCRNFRPESVFLRTLVEEFPVHKRYRVSATLDVPGTTLVAIEEEGNPETAIRRAFEELDRQLEAHKSALRGEQWWKRTSGRKELREAQAGTKTGASFFALVDPHVDWLSNFVQHALAFAVSRGDLPEGRITPEELMDQTILRAFEAFAQSPPRGSVRNWLMQRALRQLEREIERYRRESRETAARVEEDVPENPPTREVTTLGEEIFEFYQPDEDLRMEDILPDLRVTTPEQNAGNSEMRKCIRSVVKSMPKDRRRALFLRYALGVTGRELQREMKRSKEQVERLLEQARQEFRQRLAEAGCSFESPKVTPATAWNLIGKQVT